MDVPLITMDRQEAREQLRSYRSQLHKRADAEYEAVARGLAALADGTPILSLNQVMQAAGFDELMRPRLAIARADTRQVRFSWGPGTTIGVFNASKDRRITPTLHREVDFGHRHGRTYEHHPTWGMEIVAYSLVPMIPASVRELVRFNARECFILWEAERWSETPLRAEPDRDPYLLRHLHGDAYAVLAEWDLTPLEQLVMAGRRGQ